MLAALADHVWQSALFCALVEALARIGRTSIARLRLELWRIAAAKFLFPFAILYAAGEWLGFPVKHSADPPPPLLASWIDICTPWLSPARTSGSNYLALFLTLSLALTVACAWRITRLLRVETMHDIAEKQLPVGDDTRKRPVFLHAALLTACALSILAAPLLAGAVHDRQRRIAWLIDNSRALRDATITLTPAAPGMGSRYRVDVDRHGVTIRNANVRELVAIAYGVSHFAVSTNQMNTARWISWLVWPRYDMRAVGIVPRPEDFDPYALRQGMTTLLAARFGLQIELNSVCQPPCGSYNVPLPDSPL